MNSRIASQNRSSAPTPKHTVDHDLILSHREQALRVGRAMIRRWGLALSPDDATSTVDYSLCEAALTFDPSRGATLITWFFYALKTELGKLAAERAHLRETRPICHGSEDRTDNERGEAVEVPCPTPSPEQRSEQLELTTRCHQALEALDNLERRVIFEVIVAEEKVARVARRLGYSRGHLSLIKSTGVRKLRTVLHDLQPTPDWTLRRCALSPISLTQGL